MKNPIKIVRNYEECHRADIVHLMLEQDRRQNLLGLHSNAIRTQEQIERSMKLHDPNTMQPLLALNEDGNVRGYVQPVVWVLQESENTLLQMLHAQRNGVALNLTLPAPQDEEAKAVAEVLLAALSEEWENNRIGGNLICWSCHDTWVEPVFFAQRFQRRSICGSFPVPLSSVEQVAPSIRLRIAKESDERALIELFREEKLPDSDTSLEIVRMNLCRTWTDSYVEEGAPLVLIAESDEEIVACAEAAIVNFGSGNDLEMFPLGCYGIINHVSVRDSFRRQGLGHKLIQVIVSVFSSRQIEPRGWLLRNTLVNSESNRFWPHLNFQPLLTLYQREAGTFK